jgi:hypothetical protein
MPIILPTMLRPRQEFPTPLFKVTIALALAAVAAIVVLLVH